MRRYVFSLTALWLASRPTVAMAWTNPLLSVKCNGLPGCGNTNMENILSREALPTLIEFLLKASAALAMLFVVYGGCLMLFSSGDESKFTKARTTLLYALGGLGIAVVSGTAVSFIATQNFAPGGGDLFFDSGGVAATILTIAVLLFNVAFAIVTVIAGMRMVLATGKSDQFESAMSTLKGAIMGAIIVNIARALVQAFLSLNL